MNLRGRRSANAAGQPRRWRGVDILLWAVLVTVSATLVVNDLLNSNGFALAHGTMVGRDFLNAWAGGHLVLHGQVDQIYSVDAYLDALRRLLGHPVDFHAFSYPPTLLMFLWPLGLFGYAPALLIWVLATGAAFLLAARPYLRSARLPLLIAALLPASIVNIWAGHHGFVLAALWLLAFRVMPMRPLLAGVLIALLTLKPHMGVLIPLLLLVRGEWRTIAAAAVGTLTLIAASVLLFGWDVWSNYFEETTRVQSELLAGQSVFFLTMMPTPYVSLWVASGSMPLAIAMHALFAIAALVILVRSALRDLPWPELGMMAATTTFLVLPYAFNYDMAVVGLSAAMLLYGRSRELDPAARLFALLALAAPILVLAANPLGLPLLPFTLLGFLVTQARCYGASAAGAEQRAQAVQPATA